MNHEFERGSAVVEFAIVSFVLSMLLGGAIEYGIAMSTSQKLHNAVREGARIAAALPNVTTDNDPRIIQSVENRLQTIRFANYVSDPVVTSTAPDVSSSLNMVNGDPATCNASITVHVSATFSFAILRAIGWTEPMDLSQRTTMRYQQQPLCTR